LERELAQGLGLRAKHLVVAARVTFRMDELPVMELRELANVLAVGRLWRRRRLLSRLGARGRIAPPHRRKVLDVLHRLVPKSRRVGPLLAPVHAAASHPTTQRATMERSARSAFDASKVETRVLKERRR
jgi:hypothetical protein